MVQPGLVVGALLLGSCFRFWGPGWAKRAQLSLQPPRTFWRLSWSSNRRAWWGSLKCFHMALQLKEPVVQSCAGNSLLSIKRLEQLYCNLSIEIYPLGLPLLWGSMEYTGSPATVPGWLVEKLGWGKAPFQLNPGILRPLPGKLYFLSSMMPGFMEENILGSCRCPAPALLTLSCGQRSPVSLRPEAQTPGAQFWCLPGAQSTPAPWDPGAPMQVLALLEDSSLLWSGTGH